MVDIRIPSAGDPFYAADIARRTEAGLVEAMADEEARLGRPMIPSEREEFARRFFAPEYRGEISLLTAMGIVSVDEEEVEG